MRTFETGATRDKDTDKYDYEGFLSPLVLERYAAYMHEHRQQADGGLRESDNWQKGIPRDAYMKSLWRHVIDAWKLHRGVGPAQGVNNTSLLQEALCAVLFNVMGYLHELLKPVPPTTQASTSFAALRVVNFPLPEAADGSTVYPLTVGHYEPPAHAIQDDHGHIGYVPAQKMAR